MSVSKLLAEIVTQGARRTWPEGWLERVAGAWPEAWPTVDDPPQDERCPLKMLLLDANVCIDVLRGRADVDARLTDHGPAGLFLCTVVNPELTNGARLASDPARAAAPT